MLSRKQCCRLCGTSPGQWVAVICMSASHPLSSSIQNGMDLEVRKSIQQHIKILEENKPEDLKHV